LPLGTDCTVPETEEAAKAKEAESAKYEDVIEWADTDKELLADLERLVGIKVDVEKSRRNLNRPIIQTPNVRAGTAAVQARTELDRKKRA